MIKITVEARNKILTVTSAEHVDLLEALDGWASDGQLVSFEGPAMPSEKFFFLYEIGKKLMSRIFARPNEDNIAEWLVENQDNEVLKGDIIDIEEAYFDSEEFARSAE